MNLLSCPSPRVRWRPVGIGAWPTTTATTFRARHGARPPPRRGLTDGGPWRVRAQGGPPVRDRTLPQERDAGPGGARLDERRLQTHPAGGFEQGVPGLQGTRAEASEEGHVLEAGQGDGQDQRGVLVQRGGPRQRRRLARDLRRRAQGVREEEDEGRAPQEREARDSHSQGPRQVRARRPALRRLGGQVVLLPGAEGGDPWRPVQGAPQRDDPGPHPERAVQLQERCGWQRRQNPQLPVRQREKVRVRGRQAAPVPARAPALQGRSAPGHQAREHPAGQLDGRR
mmetsp:Transcript_3658/g.12841  ORF Transcript_3658/g.12841 Transcript_3658/m.12841 type:complete len:284 (-) Transcript_3658:954-1805(-)